MDCIAQPTLCIITRKGAETIKGMLVSLREGKKQSIKDNDDQSERPIETGSSSYLSPSQQLTLALIREIQQTASSCGAEFVVLDIPRRPSRTQFVSVFPPVVEGQPALPVVSPIKAFEQHPGELLYWERSHWHFTPLGTQLVGKELADYILRHQLLGRPEDDN